MTGKVLSMPVNGHSKAPVKVTVSKDAIKKLMEPLILSLEPYIPEDMSEDRLQEIIDFAVDLYAKYHTHMKEDRMRRKIVEHFKLKLREEQ